ncbi:glycosyltransferase [Marinilabilia salmonicolor]|uniref:Putative rhamnosyltransferase n=1 Tax=Marinilabilia salmonicolor TaxID=989 RepID=A0A368UJ68_9BACT|nr:glycosyltransferase [Marinilabilia salmonicolor]RCW27029.1 putative rhamnosyltransferase [Marinilabilia salmonicolor]
MANQFDHFLITRFNVPWVDGKASDEDWLSQRMEIFIKYCLPSVKSQTSNNFTWLIYLDVFTPEWALNQLKNNLPKNTLLITVNTFEQMKKQVRSDLTQINHQKADYIITSRLDNDDAISPQYIELIQQNFKEKHGKFINFQQGLCYSIEKQIFSAYTYNNSPFLSKIERVNKGVSSILAHDHVETLAQIQLDGNHWVQIIHGQNVSNGLRGKIIRAANLKKQNNWLSQYKVDRLNYFLARTQQLISNGILFLKRVIKTILFIK